MFLSKCFNLFLDVAPIEPIIETESPTPDLSPSASAIQTASEGVTDSMQAFIILFAILGVGILALAAILIIRAIRKKGA